MRNYNALTVIEVTVDIVGDQFHPKDVLILMKANKLLSLR